MAANPQLDLIGVVSPFCLLQFKTAMARVRPFQVLDVLIEDPAVVTDLVRLVNRSEDRLLASERIGDHYRIRVQRAGSRQPLGKEEA